MILQLLVRVFLLLFVIYFIFGFFIIIVKENQVYLVEKLGKFYKELNSGVHFLIPFVDMIVFKSSLSFETYKSKELEFKTKDNKIIKLFYSFEFKILSAKNYFYSSNRNINSIPVQIEIQLTNEIKKFELKEIKEFQYLINQNLTKDHSDKRDFGYELKTFQILV